jgi:hypothetical protein
MEVKVFIGGNIDINMVDVWYKENYWTTTSNLIGERKTGPFRYNKGLRQAIIWDGAGSILFEINDLDLPPYRPIIGTQVSGRAFYKIKDQHLRYGDHRWIHEYKPEE